MFLHKKIIFDDLEILQKQVLDIIGNLDNQINSLPNLSYNWSSQLKKNVIINKNLYKLKWLKKINEIAISTIPPHGKLVIHTDTAGEKFSLNIPILNCDNTFTIFYRSKSKSIEHFQHDNIADHKHQYHVFAEKDCEEIDRIELTSPYLINVSVPHDAINPNNSLRILLLIRFKTQDLDIP